MKSLARELLIRLALATLLWYGAYQAVRHMRFEPLEGITARTMAWVCPSAEYVAGPASYEHSVLISPSPQRCGTCFALHSRCLGLQYAAFVLPFFVVRITPIWLLVGVCSACLGAFVLNQFRLWLLYLQQLNEFSLVVAFRGRQHDITWWVGHDLVHDALLVFYGVLAVAFFVAMRRVCARRGAGSVAEAKEKSP